MQQLLRAEPECGLQYAPGCTAQQPLHPSHGAAVIVHPRDVCPCVTLQEFGPEWAKEHLVPQVLGMVKNPHYLYRMTVLVAISSLANYVSQEVFVSTMLPVLVQCAKDRVPNVKFNVAKVRCHTEVACGAFGGVLHAIAEVAS